MTSRQPSGQALPSAGNGPLPCRPPPRPLQGRRFPPPGPERNLYVPVPALSRTRPSVALWLLTYELLSNFAHVNQNERNQAPVFNSPVFEDIIYEIALGLLASVTPLYFS